MGLRPRIIPVLLLHQNGIYKTRQFKNPSYIGDPLNIVKIFNDKEVDELLLLDIDASVKGSNPDYNRLFDITGEAFMPISYGGGIHNVEQVKELFSTGIEKVVLNSVLLNNLNIVENLVAIYGSQSIVANIDYKSTFFSTSVYFFGGKQKSHYHPLDWAEKLAACGVGEIILNNFSREGMGNGFDLDMLKKATERVKIPIVISGGASTLKDLNSARNMGASAMAAGSMFVFKQPHRAVLINYPSDAEIEKIMHD
jgi:cyclase